MSFECIFVGYPNGVKGYRLIDISSDHLIIECSFQFKESVSHVPQQLPDETLLFFHLLEMMSMHMLNLL
jgi:hypothetical protein